VKLPPSSNGELDVRFATYWRWRVRCSVSNVPEGAGDALGRRKLVGGDGAEWLSPCSMWTVEVPMQGPGPTAGRSDGCRHGGASCSGTAEDLRRSRQRRLLHTVNIHDICRTGRIGRAQGPLGSHGIRRMSSASHDENFSTTAQRARNRSRQGGTMAPNGRAGIQWVWASKPDGSSGESTSFHPPRNTIARRD
jgi:hypothetical protein